MEKSYFDKLISSYLSVRSPDFQTSHWFSQYKFYENCQIQYLVKIRSILIDVELKQVFLVNPVDNKVPFPSLYNPFDMNPDLPVRSGLNKALLEICNLVGLEVLPREPREITLINLAKSGIVILWFLPLHGFQLKLKNLHRTLSYYDVVRCLIDDLKHQLDCFVPNYHPNIPICISTIFLPKSSKKGGYLRYWNLAVLEEAIIESNSYK
jgi:hypothetical protein